MFVIFIVIQTNACNSNNTIIFCKNTGNNCKIQCNETRGISCPLVEITEPTKEPTLLPTAIPTMETEKPTMFPTFVPTFRPTEIPTLPTSTPIATGQPTGDAAVDKNNSMS